MYLLDATAQRYATLPSNLIGVRNPWLAYTFDRLVMQYGNYVEAKLAKRSKSGKRWHTLEEILAGPGAEPRTSMAAIGSMFGKSMEQVKD